MNSRDNYTLSGLVYIVLLGAFFLFSKVSYSQPQSLFVQPMGATHVAFEAEDYAYLFDRSPSNTVTRFWQDQVDANASGGEALIATGGNMVSANPLTEAKAVYYFQFLNPGTYYLYIRYFASNGSENTLYVPDGFNKPSRSADTNLPFNNSNYLWEEYGSAGNFPGFYTVNVTDVGFIQTLSFIPREPDFRLDKIVLSQTAGLSNAQLDALSLTPVQQPFITGLLGYSSFEQTPVELAIDNFASDNIFYAEDYPNYLESYFPFLGESYLVMDKVAGGIAGNPVFVSEEIDINCYSDGYICLRLFSPSVLTTSSSNGFENDDIFSATLIYKNEFGIQVSIKQIYSANGPLLNTLLDCYTNLCFPTHTPMDLLPMGATSVCLRLQLASSATDEDIYLDEVLFYTTDIANAPNAILSCSPPVGLQASFDGSASMNPTSYFWDFGDGTTLGPTPLSTPTHTYPASGSYIVCMYVLDACGNPRDVIYKIVDVVDPLPVELSFFEVVKEGNDALLKWETQSESGNDFYEIQHSADGRNFRVLDRMEGAGTTTETQQYQFLHKEPHNGINYYRLRQVDLDGSFEYSPIRAVTFNRKDNIQIYPNPTTREVRITGFGDSSVTYRLLNSTGELLLNGSFPAGSPKVDLNHFPAGIYLLQVRDQNDRLLTNERILKIK